MNVQRRLGIGSYKTAWLMSHKIRRALTQQDGQQAPAGSTANCENRNGVQQQGRKPGQPRIKKPVLITGENHNGVHLFERVLVACLTADPSPEPVISK